MNNVKSLTLSAWQKALVIVWASPLIKFMWSRENAFFIELKMKSIIDNYEKSLQDFFNPHKDTKFVILHNRIHILLSEDSPLPIGFSLSEKHPMLTKSFSDGVSKMGVEHFERNKAAYRQEVLEADIVFELVNYIFYHATFIKASLEVKCIIDHFSQQVSAENLARKCNKSIEEK
jgi:hypothetical protein